MSAGHSSPDADQNLFDFSSYHEHLAHVRAHLAGDDGNSLQPSCIAPTGYWTPAEKNLFFHALCIYSRLRPDLIADCIQTKTTIEVCAYLDNLDEAAAQHDRQTIRRQLPCAVEVSNDWIKVEERASQELAARELHWEEWAVSETRDDFHREEILRRLEAAHLNVIESILRDDEERPSGEELTPGPSSPRRPVRSTSTPPPSALTSPLSAGNEDRSSVVPEDLSPASRRRYQKRLYMRRKRAAAAGTETVTDAVRLKRGRKQMEKPHRPRPKVYRKRGRVNGGRKGESENMQINGSGDVDMADGVEAGNTGADQPQRAGDSHADSGLKTPVEAGDDEHAPSLRHPHISGRKVYYKVKDKLAGARIDASWLRDNGLGLINLRSLGKCMRTVATRASPNVVSGISADTIQFLNAHLVDFVTDLCYRVVVSREQERIFKTRTRAWHFQTEQVQVASVEHALEMMGFSALAEGMKRAQAMDDVDWDESKRGHRRGKVRQESDNDGDSDLADADENVLLTTHDEIYLPFIRLPPHSYPSSSSSIVSQLPSSYAVGDTDDLLPLELDEDALVSELMEEEELNDLDEESEAVHEVALWQSAFVWH